jgi:ferredoxin
MRYAYPPVPDTGMRLKTLLSVYREAGGKDACVLFHDAREGRGRLLSLGRRKGLPARALPLECFHAASIGIDLLLGAIAYGASQVRVLATGKLDQGYARALERQMGYAQQILHALGYEGGHFALLDSGRLEEGLWRLAPARSVARPASFNLSAEKRGSLDFALEHLAREAAQPVEEIALAAGAPFGTLRVDKEACTLCKACIGACPAAALLDAPDYPRLRFIERNCVQCGLCASTCPEDAIELAPRLLLGARAKEAVTLNEAEPFNCVRCGKPFGTRKVVDGMLARLGGHAMFAGGAPLRRLQMCAECRVVDMMENKSEATIFDYTGRK